ncbi:XRE family transcriptional regulator [Lysinibacillus sphaericus]|uniref:XRE family transcriptional regulator n=2 Tax=Lysinibacillus TaxID=400634 RepID=W7RPV4_LYSSH|nr:MULTISPECIES: XRE family transcriptional regulator [Lysinibacillus]MBE5083785.1 XRE family transcriptional regulator [Bacillus thuringiensis]EWH33627.1 XRE family transcriptional regulator [Lysinibacillus sphaericus CBAM5]MCS1395768.1 XRE family transcriptional regulator [Lysinibacillus sp. PB211]MDR0157959.1 XRE family transcriptional regulator [Lysinibacillus sphaericus]QPA51254.1 XRE family transcriptional regulator [Lysinibacillus sphaericus]
MTQIELFLMRRQKRIKLSDIAKHIDCSIALLSRHENNKVAMDSSKVKMYKEYILNN